MQPARLDDARLDSTRRDGGLPVDDALRDDTRPDDARREDAATMLTNLPFDHVGIAVHSIEDTRARYEDGTAQGRATEVVELDAEGVNVLLLGTIELIEPRGPDSSVARFLEKRGAGLHHVAFQVRALPEAIATLEAQGFEPIDHRPRPGAAGHPVAFLHPRSTGGVLIELVEIPGD